MRGPAYSTDREQSHEFEHGSPTPSSFIDPALAQIAGPAYSPAYYTNGGLGNVNETMLVRIYYSVVLLPTLCSSGRTRRVALG
jgi:hypothetical protein